MYTRCTLCGEAGHTMLRCPMLTDPLKPGFSGAGGGGGGGDEDDHLDLLRKQFYLPCTLLVECKLEDRGTRHLDVGSIKRRGDDIPRTVLH